MAWIDAWTYFRYIALLAYSRSYYDFSEDDRLRFTIRTLRGGNACFVG